MTTIRALSLPPASLAGVSEAQYRELLSPEAVLFLEGVGHEFGPHVRAVLQARIQRQHEVDAGAMPDFLPETACIRAADWRIGPIPADLRDRRVEITGPTDRKMIINGLNSGARVFMADCEDSSCPTWANVIAGQLHLRDAVRRNV